MASSSIRATAESSSDECRFRPGDLVRVLADDLSFHQPLRPDDARWNDVRAVYTGQVGVVQKILNEGQVSVAFIRQFNKGVGSLPGFVEVDERGRIAIFHIVFNEKSLKSCATACYLPGEMAVVHPYSDHVAALNEHLSGVDEYKSWCGELVRVEDTPFGMVTVSIMGREGVKETINLMPACLIPVLSDSERLLALGGENCLPRPDSSVVRWRDEVAEPKYKSMFLGKTEKPTSDDLRTFYRAIDSKDANLLEAYLKRYPNAVDVPLGPAGETALMYAVKTNELSTVKLLLQHGANPLHKSGDGLTSFDIFFELEQNGDLHILDRLIDHSLPNANIVLNSGLTLLLEAVVRRLFTCVRILLQSKCVDVNAQDKNGRTALHHVVLGRCDESSELQCVSLLLQHNADILFADNAGFTSIHLAAKVGKFRLLMLMLNKYERAGDAQKETDGWTALHLAAVNGHYKIVEELAKNDWCSTSIKTFDGHSVMHLVVATLYVEVYKRHKPGIDGRTYRADLFRVIDLLVESDASLGEGDSDNDSVVHIAMHQLCLAMTSGRKPSKQIIEQLFLLDKKGKEMKLVGDLLPICEAWPQLAVVCFFLAKGASIHFLNSKQMSVLESSPPEIRFLLYSYHMRCRNMRILSSTMGNRPTMEDSLRQCLFCKEVPNVMFNPCGHKAPFCSTCAHNNAVLYIKRCSTCRQTVVNPTAMDRRPSISPPSLQDDNYHQTLRQLEELKSTLTCQICADNETNIVLQCGHLVCEDCSKKILRCPFCLTAIETRTKIYRS